MTDPWIVRAAFVIGMLIGLTAGLILSAVSK